MILESIGASQIQLCLIHTSAVGEPVTCHWLQSKPVFFINVTLFRKMFNDIHVKKYKPIAIKTKFNVFNAITPIVEVCDKKNKEPKLSSEESLKYELMYKQLLLVAYAVTHCLCHHNLKTQWVDHTGFILPESVQDD